LPNVEVEFERDGPEITISARSNGTNFIFVLPHDGATVFADAAQRACEKDETIATSRFTIRGARLEVSK